MQSHLCKFVMLRYANAIQEGLPMVIKLVIHYTAFRVETNYILFDKALVSQRINAAVIWYLEWINQYTLLYNSFGSRSPLHFQVFSRMLLAQWADIHAEVACAIPLYYSSSKFLKESLYFKENSSLNKKIFVFTRWLVDQYIHL